MDDNPISVVWYDGNQKCQVSNALPTVSNGKNVISKGIPCPLHGHICNQDVYVHTDIANGIQTLGLDNIVFYDSDYDERAGCSKIYKISHRITGNVENNVRSSHVHTNTTDGDTSNTCACKENMSSHSNTLLHKGQLKSGFEEHYNAFEKDGYWCDMNQRRNTEIFDIDIESAIELTEESDVQCSSSNNTSTHEKRIHVIKQTMLRPNSIDTIVVCNVCQNEIPISKPSTVYPEDDEENEEPPPNYSSLRYMFLADEPPKYQDVTGKKLTCAIIPVRVSDYFVQLLDENLEDEND